MEAHPAPQAFHTGLQLPSESESELADAKSYRLLPVRGKSQSAIKGFHGVPSSPGGTQRRLGAARAMLCDAAAAGFC